MKSPLERAFELASSGQVDTIKQLRRALSKEGYEVEQITGPVLYEQLRKRMKAAKASATLQSA
jgi:hypothetical protein